jgi:microcystin-dependent protein
VGGVVALLTTVLTIFGNDNHLNRLSTQANAIDTRIKFAVPVGTIVAYGGPVEDDRKKELDDMGWLLCDGSLVPTGDKYERLSKLLGRVWGKGNNSDRVSLPDLQGMFLRGVDPIGKADPDFRLRTNWSGDRGPLVGSFQSNSLATHQHFAFKNTNVVGRIHITATRTAVNEGKSDGVDNYVIRGSEFEADTGLTSKTGSSETRPNNAYVHYLIKY